MNFGGAMSRNSAKLIGFLYICFYSPFSFSFFLSFNWVRGFVVAASSFQRDLGLLRKDQQPGQGDGAVDEMPALQEVKC